MGECQLPDLHTPVHAVAAFMQETRNLYRCVLELDKEEWNVCLWMQVFLRQTGEMA